MLGSNREGRANYRRRVKKESFGIYRPLTDESAKKIWDALGETISEIAPLYGKYGKNVAAPIQMGVTFTPRREVRSALGRGLLQRFEPGRMISQLESKADPEDIKLKVPLAGAEWFSSQDRDLGFRFEPSAATEELAQEAEIIRAVLENANAGSIPVYVPDHLTILKSGVGRKEKFELGEGQRRVIAGAIENCFEKAGIEAITLAGMQIGDNYNGKRQA